MVSILEPETKGCKQGIPAQTRCPSSYLPPCCSDFFLFLFLFLYMYRFMYVEMPAGEACWRSLLEKLAGEACWSRRCLLEKPAGEACWRCLPSPARFQQASPAGIASRHLQQASPASSPAGIASRRCQLPECIASRHCQPP